MKFLFDLGGVFFDWDPNFFFENIINDKSRRRFFLQNVCNDKWNLAQDKGRSIKKGELILIRKFPQFEEEIKMYYKNHSKMFRKVFYQSVEILEELKKQKYLCYVLSNWSNETFVGMNKKYPFLNLFDGLIISGKEKMIKPDKNIYNLAIRRFDLIPSNTIFVDDKIENINTAKIMGFKTIHLTNPDIIKNKIKKIVNL